MAKHPPVPGPLWFQGMYSINLSSGRLYNKFFCIFDRIEEQEQRRRHGISLCHPIVHTHKTYARPPRVSKEALEARNTRKDKL